MQSPLPQAPFGWRTGRWGCSVAGGGGQAPTKCALPCCSPDERRLGAGGHSLPPLHETAVLEGGGQVEGAGTPCLRGLPEAEQWLLQCLESPALLCCRVFVSAWVTGQAGPPLLPAVPSLPPGPAHRHSREEGIGDRRKRGLWSLGDWAWGVWMFGRVPATEEAAEEPCPILNRDAALPFIGQDERQVGMYT